MPRIFLTLIFVILTLCDVSAFSMKNRVGDFFEAIGVHAPVEEPQLLILIGENEAFIYDTASGSTHWLSREPLGEGASANLYAFANNDPINNIDVLGLDYIKISGGIAYWIVESDNLISTVAHGVSIGSVDGDTVNLYGGGSVGLSESLLAGIRRYARLVRLGQLCTPHEYHS